MIIGAYKGMVALGFLRKKYLGARISGLLCQAFQSLQGEGRREKLVNKASKKH